MTEQSGTTGVGPSAAGALAAVGAGISIPALLYMPFVVSPLVGEGAGVFGLIALVPVAVAGLILLVGWLAPWNVRYAWVAAAFAFAGTCWLCDFVLWLAAFAHSKAG